MLMTPDTGALPIAKVMTQARAEVRPNGEVFIYGVIGSEVDGLDSATLVRDLKDLEADTIRVHINSPGGFVTEGVAIFNALKQHAANVIVTIDALAASMASAVAMAGDEIVMPANAVMMIHNPWTGSVGDAEQLRKDAEALDKMKTAVVSIYADRSGMSAEEVSKIMDQETWLTAEEAVELGFADRTEDAAPAENFTDIDVAALATMPVAMARRFRAVQAASSADTAATTQPKEKDDMAATPKKGPAAPKAADKTDDHLKIDVEVKADDIKAAIDESTAQAVQAERQRATAIRQAVAKAGLKADFANTLVDEGLTLDEARAKIIDGVADAHAGGEHLNIVPARVTDDVLDKFMTGAAQWLMLKAGHRDLMAKTKLALHPGEFRGFRMVDLAREALELGGVSTRGMSPDTLVKRALTARGSITQTTSDFAILLENTLHKILQAAYATTPDTWSRFCGRGSVSDFRPHNRYRRGTFGVLDEVGESGEFKNKAIPDGEKELIAAKTKGNLINLTRPAIVNDDMDAFSSLGVDLGRAAKLSVEVDAYALFALNGGDGPTLADGNPVFHASHNNIAATAGAPSADLLDAADVLMSEQRDPSGNEILDLMPALFVGPRNMRGNVITIVRAQFDPDTPNKLHKPNKVEGIVSDIVATPRLPGTAWYLFADPATAPVFEVVFLDGQDEPFLDSEEGFTVDGVRWKVRLDYGVGGVDFRGAVKNAGA